MPRAMPIRAVTGLRAHHSYSNRSNRQIRRRSDPITEGDDPCCMPCCGQRTRCKPRIYICAIIIFQITFMVGFLLYDLAQVARFEAKYEEAERDNFSKYRSESNEGSDDGDDDKKDEMTVKELKDLHRSYQRQESMAIAVLLLLIILIATVIAVNKGYKLRQSQLFLPFLILAFPVLTAAMIYVILFRVEDEDIAGYVKIISMVVIFTVIANIYRVIYREYHMIKSEERHTRRRSNVSSISQTVAPVILQMKPPPYEKEPPPYSLTAPDLSSPPYTPIAEDSTTNISIAQDVSYVEVAPVSSSTFSSSTSATSSSMSSVSSSPPAYSETEVVPLSGRDLALVHRPLVQPTRGGVAQESSAPSIPTNDTSLTQTHRQSNTSPTDMSGRINQSSTTSTPIIHGITPQFSQVRSTSHLGYVNPQVTTDDEQFTTVHL